MAAAIALALSPALAAQQTPQPALQPEAGIQEILDGGVPKSVADLKAMERHTQKLLKKVLPCTVSCGGATGVLIKGGYVLTAAHVINAPGRDIRVVLLDGRRLQGNSLGLNHRSDAGLVKLEAKDAEQLPALEMGKSQDLKAGQWVMMLGHTGGLKTWRTPPMRVGRFLRIAGTGWLVTDCTMAGGDSGGPLFDMDGRVIGINSRISWDLENNMHVPVDAFHRDWDRLVKADVIGRRRDRRGPPAMLGVVADLSADVARILKVTPGSPAAKAGIRAGDVVLRINGREVRTPRALGRRIRYGFGVGDRITVEVRRGEKELEFEITLVERPPEMPEPEKEPEREPEKKDEPKKRVRRAG